jgi:hypothetical protein
MAGMASFCQSSDVKLLPKISLHIKRKQTMSLYSIILNTHLFKATSNCLNENISHTGHLRNSFREGINWI